MKTKIISLFLIWITTLYAQEERVEVEDFATGAGDTVVSKKSFGLVGYPIIFYTPETQLAAGAGGMLYFRTAEIKNIRPSKVILSAWYTINNQYYFKIAPQIYFPSVGQDLLDMRFIYSKEIGKFYGLGNHSPEIDNPDYTMKSWRFYMEFGASRIISDNIHTGLIIDFSNSDIVDKQSNPFLINNMVPGSNGGTVNGVGALFTWDARDNIFYPTVNYFHKIRFQYFGKFLGGDYTFNRLVLDFRYYLSPLPTHILAFQVYSDITAGIPPFFRLPALGGDQRMRGYFTGRYRDKIFLTSQIEYRKILWWRLGIAAFVGAGDVASDWSVFNTRTIKYSYGFGFRFVFDESEKINLRMDIGFGKNTSGIYFALEEAF